MFLHLFDFLFLSFGLVLHIPLHKVFGNVFSLNYFIEELVGCLRDKGFSFGDLFEVLDFLLLFELVFLFLSLHHFVVELFLTLLCSCIRQSLFLHFFKLFFLLLFFQASLLLGFDLLLEAGLLNLFCQLD
jgi:hypothetical protein